jgi:hypothetical protein
VQGGIGDGDPGHLHGFEPRHRRGGAGAADLDLDRLHRGHLFLGRKLVRQRPARRARDESHRLLAGIVVELVDHAVDVVRQAVAFGADAPVIGDEPFETARQVDFRRHRKAELSQLHQGGRMGRRQRPTRHFADAVGVEAELAPRGDRRVELTQRAGRAVARIGQRLLAVTQRVGIEGLEILAQHDHLAAHLEHARTAIPAQSERDRAHRAQVGGDVLAGGAVAARGAEHEHAVLVTQADRQTVELGFHGEHRIAPVERLFDPLHELGHLAKTRAVVLARLLESVVQREHRNGVMHLGKTALHARADRTRGRVGGGQRRVLGLQRLQFAHQAVVLGVGDVRIVEHVVAVVGILDTRAQCGGARGDLVRHGGIRGGAAHPASVNRVHCAELSSDRPSAMPRSGRLGLPFDGHHLEPPPVPAGHGPIDRLADPQAEQSATDGSQNRHRPRRAGGGRVDQLDHLPVTLGILETDPRMHGDHVGRHLLRLAHVGAIEFGP